MGAYMNLVAVLTCAYAATSALEWLALRGELADGGLLSWENQRVASPGLWEGRSGRVLAALYRHPKVRALYLLQLALACTVVFTLRDGPTVAVCALFLVTWLISQRTMAGQDGADQMALLVMLALSIWVLVPTPLAQLAAVAFIAGEGLLSYLIAGVAKLSEPGWRDGSHLAAIFRTDAYGLKPIGDLLLRRQPLAAALSMGFICWECTVPFAMFAPRSVAYAYLAIGLVFHVMNAVVMGLNTFLFAFSATYPATLYLLKRAGE